MHRGGRRVVEIDRALGVVMGLPAGEPQSTSISRLKSTASDEWVSAPDEIRSTPVSARSRTVSRVTLPEHSVRARPPMRRTASRISSFDMLSSRMMSAPPARAGSICSSEVTSTSTSHRVRHALLDRPDGVGQVEAPAAQRRQMVVLQQHGVGQVEAMVVAAAGPDRVLLQDAAAPAWSCACRSAWWTGRRGERRTPRWRWRCRSGAGGSSAPSARRSAARASAPRGARPPRPCRRARRRAPSSSTLTAGSTMRERLGEHAAPAEHAVLLGQEHAPRTTARRARCGRSSRHPSRCPRRARAG